MTYWAIEFQVKPNSKRGGVHIWTIRHTRREAWQAVIDINAGDTDWWEEVHRRRSDGSMLAVKVNITKVPQ